MKVSEEELYEAIEYAINETCESHDDVLYNLKGCLKAMMGKEDEYAKDLIHKIRAYLLKNINLEF